MRKEIVNLIKIAYRDNSFSKPNYKVWEIFPNQEVINNIVKDIESHLQVNVYSYTDKNYDSCYWIDISTSKKILVSTIACRNREEQMEWLKKVEGHVYEAGLQISMLGPYAVLRWGEMWIENEKIKVNPHNEPPTSECIKLQKKIIEILKKYNIEILSWSELDEIVEWLEPGSTLQNTPTVYNCLFSEF